MRLYHERQRERPAGIDRRDEEECFTAAGRRKGVYLTTEALRGADVFSAEVPDEDVAPFEVTGDGAVHRSFVVPGDVVAKFGLSAAVAAR